MTILIKSKVHSLKENADTKRFNEILNSIRKIKSVHNSKEKQLMKFVEAFQIIINGFYSKQ